MNRIKLNNNEFELESYTKNTHFSDVITSSGMCTLIMPDIDLLQNMAKNPLTSIEISANGTTIYALHDINATIDSTSEFLNNDRINVNVNFTFSNT